MKCAIQGRRYDTEAPGTTLVAARSADTYATDFRHWSEELFRTKRGRWFLAGEGGALSRWSRPDGENGRTGSAGIQPLSPEEALRWLEDAEAAEAIDQYFGDQVEDA